MSDDEDEKPEPEPVKETKKTTTKKNSQKDDVDKEIEKPKVNNQSRKRFDILQIEILTRISKDNRS